MFTPQRLTCAALVTLLAFAPGAARSQQSAGFADAVLGRWDLTIADGELRYPSWLEIRLRTEGELMGRFVGRFGSVRHLPVITFLQDTLRFSAPLQYESGVRALEFLGRVEGGRLVGTMTDAAGRMLEWTGVASPTLARSVDVRRGRTIALFNGTDLSGWRARDGSSADCWQISLSQLAATPPCVDLVTQMQFDDFELEIEFAIPAGSNSGVYLRGRYEVQIQDTAGQALDALRMGAVYGFITPVTDAAGQPGDWQSMRIRLLGRKITVVLNGTTIIDAETIPGITGGALDSNEAAAGPIMIQGDHGAIRFRRIELTPLIAESP